MRWEGSSDESKGIAIITVKGVECRVPLKTRKTAPCPHSNEIVTAIDILGHHT